MYERLEGRDEESQLALALGVSFPKQQTQIYG